MVNKTNNKQSGFSLFEACVTMLIVGIFVAMCANAYTKKHITYQESDGHGRYECYRSGAGIVQRYVENNSPRSIPGNTCVFRPPRYAKYILINAVGGGSASGAGEFASVFYSSIDTPLTIDPGAVGSGTYVKKDGSNILSLSSGSGQLTATSSGTSKISTCNVTQLSNECSSNPVCAQDGSNVVVKYCKGVDYSTIELPLSYVKDYRTTASGSNLVYKDIQDYVSRGGLSPKDAVSMVNGVGGYPSYFTLNITFDTSTTTASQMVGYLNALGITDGIATASPGSPGKGGGVLILW